MYNQGNMRLHVDLFIKYVSNNVYSDNNLGQPQSILNIFLTFFSSLYFMTTFCGLFSVWYWYHCLFLLGGMKMSGSAGLFSKKKKFFTSSGAQRWAEREMGNTKTKYGHQIPSPRCRLPFDLASMKRKELPKTDLKSKTLYWFDWHVFKIWNQKHYIDLIDMYFTIQIP